MPTSDYLEQLLSEWYEYQGFFVHCDLWVGVEENGSYECELDVVAYHPTKHHLVHIEPSMDALKWKEREEHFLLKFEAGKRYLHRMFGPQPSVTFEQIALLISTGTSDRGTIAGGRVVLLRELLADILRELEPVSIRSNVAPDRWPLLHTFGHCCIPCTWSLSVVTLYARS